MAIARSVGTGKNSILGQAPTLEPSQTFPGLKQLICSILNMWTREASTLL
jgi:hypothetical protein